MTTVAEIIEQVRALSLEERRQVAQAVIDLLIVPSSSPAPAADRWGRSLNQLLTELPPIALVDADLTDDPAARLHHQRQKEREQRTLNAVTSKTSQTDTRRILERFELLFPTTSDFLLGDSAARSSAIQPSSR